MTDRELLELAARATGWYAPPPESERIPDDVPVAMTLHGKSWNPLDDDGDALRLAVKLGMEVYVDTHPEGCECTEAKSVTFPQSGTAVYNHDGDPYAATRRAIVRAAAEIGRMR